jgi:hypothetical protein
LSLLKILNPTNSKIFFVFLGLLLVLLILGSIKSLAFLPAQIIYILILLAIYYFGHFIDSQAINISYNWISKWLWFVVYMVYIANEQKEVFLVALFTTIIINIALQPTIFNKK